ncbi:aminopeptidase [Marinicrinis sediminis]|uniref:Aminopeptidase n=1 Tax=Marinicrinis sediminis TaxID=1652465 RepID=A0ABW5RET7_9BACL
MNTPRAIAAQLIHHSLRVSPGEKVLLDVTGTADDYIEAIVTEVYEAGAEPHVIQHSFPVLKSLVASSSQAQLQRWAAADVARIRSMNVYIGLRAEQNPYELYDLPEERYRDYVTHYLQPKQYAMGSLSKWNLLKTPTSSWAQLAHMSNRAYERLYRDACTMDYAAWAAAVQPLSEMFATAKHVRITGPSTELTFSVEGMTSMICAGQYNLPDGEWFTAPVLDSVEGHIQFNVPTSYMGTSCDQVRLVFRHGCVVEASAAVNQHWLEQMLEQDEGARKVGEFGIGLNPHIVKPTQNLIFDEKMQGSLHLALGQAYPMADNGNVSRLHWDFVLLQSESHGGGSIEVDGELVRHNGRFVLPELEALNGPA